MASDRDSISAAYDALESAFETVASLSHHALGVAETLGCFDRLEGVRRRMPAAEHNCWRTHSRRPPPPRSRSRAAAGDDGPP